MAGISKETIAATRISYLQPDRGLWQWCLKGKTLSRLCILIALALIASLVIPQSPTDARFDSVKFEQWLLTTSTFFQSWSSLLNSLGLFHVLVTPWFRFLLAVTAFVSLVALGNQIDSTLRPSPVRRDPFYNAPDTVVVHSSLSFSDVLRAVGSMLDGLGSSVQDVQGQRAWVYGVRRRWVRLVQSLIYLGVLLIALGLAINGRWGWVQQEVPVLPVQIVSNGSGASLQLDLVSIDPQTAEVVIRPADGSDITLRKNAKTCARGFCYQLAGQARPLVRISSRDNGQTGAMYSDTGYADSTGALVFPFTPSVQSDQDSLFVAPDYGMVGQVQWQDMVDPGNQPLAFRFTVFGQDSQVLVQELIGIQEQPVSINAGEVSFDLDLLSYVVIDVSLYRGLAVIIVGVVCLIVASVSTFVSWQQVWALVTVSSNGVVTRLRARSYGRGRTWKQAYEAAVLDLRAQIQATSTERIES